MNDRFAYDVGDFGKFGILRFLAGLRGDQPPLRVGVNWYRTAGDTSGGDLTDYLQIGGPVCEPCDADLYAALKTAHEEEGERSIARLQSTITPLLGERPAFHDATIDGAADRRAWHQDALAVLAETDLILLDPDNGVAVPASPRHAAASEIRDYLERGKPLLIYDHHNHWGGVTVEQQGSAWRGEFLSWRTKSGGPLVREAHAWAFRRGTSRLFHLLIPQDAPDRIQANVESFVASAWFQTWRRPKMKPHFRSLT